MKSYWPLILFLPLVACTTVQPKPVAPKRYEPLPQPPPADGIMFVPAPEAERVKKQLGMR